MSKPREARLRQLADEQGLRLSKSRTRDPQADDYGRYTLTRDGIVDSTDLDEIAAYLNDAPIR